jgi:hypothetical protein
MFEVLEKCNYVYFFAYKRGSVNTSSACFGLSYTFLCRLVCDHKRKQQYEISSPLFNDTDDTFYLPPITEQDIVDVEEERAHLICKTSKDLKSMLKVFI